MHSHWQYALFITVYCEGLFAFRVVLFRSFKLFLRAQLLKFLCAMSVKSNCQTGVLHFLSVVCLTEGEMEDAVPVKNSHTSRP